MTISPFVYTVINPDEHTLMLSEIQNTDAVELRIHGSERYKGEDWQVKVVGGEHGIGNIGDIESIRTVIVEEGVQELSVFCFCGAKQIESIQLPDSLKTIGDSAFNNTPGLTSIEIPDTVTGVPDNCFSGCRNLVSIVLPDTLETIDTAAFSDCYNLPQLILPDGLNKLGYEAFSGCRALTEVAIPGSVSAIESEAFAMCDNLSRVVIEDGVKEIREGAFTRCTSLTEIVIPASVEIMYSGIFNNVDTDGLIIRAEEGSAAAEYAENIGTLVIGTDDVIISVSMDESRLTKYTTAFTEITASREAVSIAAVDPYSAGQFSINRDHSGLWVKENGMTVPADRTDDPDAGKLYYICLALEPVGGTVMPEEEKIAWRFNGKITETAIVQTADNELSVLFELNAPALAPAVTKYTVTVNNGAARPSEAAAGNEIALIADPAPAGKIFREWTVDSGTLPEGIDAYSSNTGFIMPENDIGLTANYISFISAAGVHNIRKTLEADCPAEFTAVVDEEYSGQVGIKTSSSRGSLN